MKPRGLLLDAKEKESMNDLGGPHLPAKEVAKVVTRLDLEECLPKGARDGLCTFWDGYRVWLVRDDFVDLAQSPGVVFVGDMAIGAFDIGTWPDCAFEFWKQELKREQEAMQ